MLREFGIEHAAHGSEKQGIVHMVGPETGRTQPGKFIVCGDSHTATHGASERSLLELGPVRSNMSLRHRPSGRSNPRKMLVEFTGFLKRSLFQGFPFSFDCCNRRCFAALATWMEYRGQAIDASEHGRTNDHLQYVPSSLDPRWES